MLNVTDKAAALLHDSLEVSKNSEEDVLRLTRSGQGLALTLDEEREGDQVVLHDEQKVLVIQPEIAQALNGATIDAVNTPDGERLAIQSPEAQ
jgi:Fe-S cluster assembly iron-binding protein IscA